MPLMEALYKTYVMELIRNNKTKEKLVMTSPKLEMISVQSCV